MKNFTKYLMEFCPSFQNFRNLKVLGKLFGIYRRKFGNFFVKTLLRTFVDFLVKFRKKCKGFSQISRQKF